MDGFSGIVGSGFRPGLEMVPQPRQYCQCCHRQFRRFFACYSCGRRCCVADCLRVHAHRNYCVECVPAVQSVSDIAGSGSRFDAVGNGTSPAGSGIRTGPAWGHRVMHLIISLILIPLVCADPRRTFDRPVSEQQRQQAIKTDIVWSGCGTYSYCHPLRIPINLGPVRVPALVDSGSDYDAIDRHLALELSRCGNMSFRSRTNVGKRSIS